MCACGKCYSCHRVGIYKPNKPRYTVDKPPTVYDLAVACNWTTKRFGTTELISYLKMCFGFTGKYESSPVPLSLALTILNARWDSYSGDF